MIMKIKLNIINSKSIFPEINTGEILPVYIISIVFFIIFINLILAYFIAIRILSRKKVIEIPIVEKESSFNHTKDSINKHNKFIYYYCQFCGGKLERSAEYCSKCNSTLRRGNIKIYKKYFLIK